MYVELSVLLLLLVCAQTLFFLSHYYILLLSASVCTRARWLHREWHDRGEISNTTRSHSIIIIYGTDGDFVNCTREFMWISLYTCDVKRICNQRSIDCVKSIAYETSKYCIHSFSWQFPLFSPTSITSVTHAPFSLYFLHYWWENPSILQLLLLHYMHLKSIICVIRFENGLTIAIILIEIMKCAITSKRMCVCVLHPIW